MGLIARLTEVLERHLSFEHPILQTCYLGRLW